MGCRNRKSLLAVIFFSITLLGLAFWLSGCSPSETTPKLVPQEKQVSSKYPFEADAAVEWSKKGDYQLAG
ncbi:hypothetical protein JW826_03735 [Candidatus Woesearchaeota archaeon]|nr:hypothetical protein [Candidatus Woesearchaeota archaeon]